MDRRTFLITTGAACLTAGRAWADRRIVNSPGDGYLNLRTGPGSNFDVIRRMGHGSSVETLEWSEGWVRVRHQSGAIGWAFGKYLARPASSGGYRVYSPGDGYLNLRTGPGTRFDILRRMYNGERVTILEVSGTWVRVRHESGAVGWCSSKFLRQ